MIDLLLLGTGGMMPLPSRWLSSLLMRTGGDLVLFDCGEGTQIPWQTFGWGFRRLGAICLSHHHADHVAGLPGLFHAVSNSGREDPVTIYGPPGTVRIVQALREIAPVLGFELKIREVDGHEQFILPGGGIGHVFRGDHRVLCNCYRIDVPRGRKFLVEKAEAEGISVRLWSKLQRGEDVIVSGRTVSGESMLGPERRGLSIGFVTDTRPVPGLPEFLDEVDLLICEGTYGDSTDLPKAIEKKHMTFAEAAGIARNANAGALWLTHFSPALSDPLSYRDLAAEIFPNVTVGFSGLQATLSFPDDG